MPVKPRKLRNRKARQTPENWLKYHAGLLRFMNVGEENPWADDDSVQYWRDHKEEIMALHPIWAQEWGKQFTRPPEWWAEEEEKHPRKRTGFDEWHTAQSGKGPGEWRKDPIYEDNMSYLIRRGLLYDFEKAIAKNWTRTTKKGARNAYT
jgi:hypothetical protein